MTDGLKDDWMPHLQGTLNPEPFCFISLVHMLISPYSGVHEVFPEALGTMDPSEEGVILWMWSSRAV